MSKEEADAEVERRAVHGEGRCAGLGRVERHGKEEEEDEVGREAVGGVAGWDVVSCAVLLIGHAEVESALCHTGSSCAALCCLGLTLSLSLSLCTAAVTFTLALALSLSVSVWRSHFHFHFHFGPHFHFHFHFGYGQLALRTC